MASSVYFAFSVVQGGRITCRVSRVSKPLAEQTSASVYTTAMHCAKLLWAAVKQKPDSRHHLTWSSPPAATGPVNIEDGCCSTSRG